MKDIDLSFIKKTSIIPNDDLVGFRRNIHKASFALEPEIEKMILEEFENIPKETRVSFAKTQPKQIIKSFHKGTKILRWDLDLKYRYLFDYATGFSARSKYLNTKQTQTGTEVFCANFPHLIYVGIMGHCAHGQSGLCLRSGVQCYQDGLHINKSNMKLDDFNRIAYECRGLTNRFALGGRGDPNEHEHFGEILKICRENHIVPNYTTSGFCLTDEQIALTKKYCGSVAVSWYRGSYTVDAINRFVSSGIKTNIHYLLNKDTVEEAIDRLENAGFPKGINAIVFFSHKPVGLGETSKCLPANDSAVQKLFGLIKQNEYDFRIGIDGNFVEYLINSDTGLNIRPLNKCEAGRFTCYIDSDMIMHPCSFDIDNKYTVDLHTCSISDAWNSEVFNSIRATLKQGCNGCDHNKYCSGYVSFIRM